MNLLKPLTQSSDLTLVVISPQFDYTDDNLQLTISTSMHFGFFYYLKAGEEPTMLVPELLPNDHFPDYLKVKQILNACANMGEAIDEQLLGLLHRAYPSRKEEFAKMDFYSRRGVFSDLVHKNKTLKVLPELNNKIRRKLITKTLADFIVYRNYYTHGALILKYGTKEYYIKCIDKPTGQERTYGIDRSILTSFIDTGAELKRLMMTILQTLPPS